MTALSRALHCPPEPLFALHPLSGLVIKPGDIEKENTCFSAVFCKGAVTLHHNHECGDGERQKNKQISRNNDPWFGLVWYSEILVYRESVVGICDFLEIILFV